MKTLTALTLALLVAAPVAFGRAAEPLPRSAPEAQGVSSRALLELVSLLDRQIEGMHSLMIVRHGRVLAEGWWAPYRAEDNHVLYSLSKSFTATAVGLAVAEKRLSVDDEVLKFFAEAAPAEPSPNLKAMRVRDLLTMTTGHQDEPPVTPEAVSARSFLAQPVPHLPGTHFKYNTAATFMLSALVQKLTGQTLLDYLRPRLFEPLGIARPVWETNFEGIALGGYGLRVRTEDLARFGQLYLQRGHWQGRSLLPAAWVEQATGKQVSNGSNPASDWNQGYGFQFWRCRHGAFRGDGAFGQFCVVLPEQDMVVAITAGTRDMQAVLNVLWDKLLPACGPQKLRSDRSGHEQLKARLAGLQLAPAQGAATSSRAASVLHRTFRFPANEQKVESLTLTSPDGGRSLTLTLRAEGREMRLPAGFQQWRRGRAPVLAGRLAQFPDEPVAGTFAWAADDTLVLKVCACETPFHLTWRLTFAGDQVSLDPETNVAFGPTKRPTLIGRAD